jgi:hypothetical protein
MNDLDSSHDRLLGDLDALYRYELRRAEVSESRAANYPPRARQMATGPLAILAATVIILFAIAVRPPIDRQPSSGASASPAESISGALATPPPTATPLVTAESTDVPATAGPLVDGVPESFGGEPVFRGPGLAAKIDEASGDEPFLAGGWLHKGEVIRFCSFQRFDPAVDLCYSFGLYESTKGGDPLWIGRGADGILPSGLAEEATRAVVLLIHTHDPRCSPDDTGCDRRPILSEVMWLGTPK